MESLQQFYEEIPLTTNAEDVVRISRNDGNSMNVTIKVEPTEPDVCRMCLAREVRMYQINNSPLEKIFERITLIKLNDDNSSPVMGCYSCLHLLKRFQGFTERCLKADALFRHMLERGLKMTNATIRSLDASILRPSLAISPTTHTSVGLPDEWNLVPIKPVEVKCEIDTDDNEIKEPMEYEGDPTPEELRQYEETSLTKKEEYAPPAEYTTIHIKKCYSAPTKSAKSKNKATVNVDNKTNSSVTEANDKPYYYYNYFKKTFNQEEKLKIQSLIDKKTNNCLICFKTLPSKYDLSLHVQSEHPEDKNYECNICGKRYLHKCDLAVHIRWHTGVRPFKCSECSLTFMHQGRLNTHMKRHAGVTYTCPVCDRTFVEKGNLRIHLRTHTGERPYSCKYCDKTFVWLSNKVKHERTHTGEKPYSCIICDRAFGDKQSMQRHTKTHK